MIDDDVVDDDNDNDSTWYKLSLVSLNNEGVNMIMEKRYYQATKAFASAVQMLQSFPQQYDGRSSSCYFDHTVYCINEHEEELSVPNIHQDDNTSLNDMNSSEEDQSSNVFQLPILIVDENQQQSSNTRSPFHDTTIGRRITEPSITMPDPAFSSFDSDEYTLPRRHPPFTMKRLDFVLFYNLALSYHLYGLLNSPSCTFSSTKTVLQSAVLCYKEAYRVLLLEQEGTVTDVMLILNNMGQIYQQLQDDSGAKNCFQRLFSTMLMIHRSGDASRIEHWNYFVAKIRCGLILTSSKSYRPAPAA